MDIHLHTWPRPLLEKHSPFLALWQIATAQRRTGRPHKTLTHLEGEIRCWNDLECQKKRHQKCQINHDFRDFHMISLQNLRVCLLILTSWSHNLPGFFSCSAPNNLGPTPPMASEPCTCCTSSMKRANKRSNSCPKKTREQESMGLKPTEESFIFGGLVTSPIYFLGPKILKPSFVHGFFGGPFWIFDGFLLKCFDSSLQLLGISNRQKHTDTHTHTFKKKCIYIYIHAIDHLKTPNKHRSKS